MITETEFRIATRRVRSYLLAVVLLLAVVAVLAIAFRSFGIATAVLVLAFGGWARAGGIVRGMRDAMHRECYGYAECLEPFDVMACSYMPHRLRAADGSSRH